MPLSESLPAGGLSFFARRAHDLRAPFLCIVPNSQPFSAKNFVQNHNKKIPQFT